MTQKPSIGRIVHYYPVDAFDAAMDPYAGIIVRVGFEGSSPGCVDLVTFGPNSIYHNFDAPFSEDPKPGHWSWPPRV